MNFLKRKTYGLLLLLVLSVPVVVYALAPIETLGQSQDQNNGEVQTGALVSPPAPTPASQDAVSQQPAPGETDNTPLVGQNSVSTNTSTIQNNPGVSLSTLPISDRVAHLEQQMQNLVQVNMPDQITNLQQQVQQLSGELQVEQHDIALLNQQLRNFYQDLAAQIKQSKNISAASTDDGASGANSGNADVSSGSNQAAGSSSTPGVALGATDKYKAALNLLAQKKYPEALKTFQAYLKTSPNGHFAASAHYWLGEIYVQMKNLGAAAVEYRRVIQNFPKSDKVADAEVKLAIIHVSVGNTVQARAEFTKVKQEYPGTTAAQLADIQLQQLGT